MKKIKLEKFELLRLRNPQFITGGDNTGPGGGDGGNTGTGKEPKCEQNSAVIIWE